MLNAKKTTATFTEGYTLIELLVTLSIIGIMFGFGYVSFRDFSRRQALSGTSKKLQGDLRLAQQQALSGKKPDNVKCNAPNRLDSVSFTVDSTSSYKIEAVCTGGNVLIRNVDLPEGISITAPSVNPIKFKILGQGTNISNSSETTIVVDQDGTSNQSIVTVTNGGEIR